MCHVKGCHAGVSSLLPSGWVLEMKLESNSVSDLCFICINCMLLLSLFFKIALELSKYFYKHWNMYLFIFYYFLFRIVCYLVF